LAGTRSAGNYFTGKEWYLRNRRKLLALELTVRYQSNTACSGRTGSEYVRGSSFGTIRHPIRALKDFEKKCMHRPNNHRDRVILIRL
jgi:hypothetical protein